MNYQELIKRQAELVAELAEIESRLYHDAGEPFGVVAAADEYDVSFHEKSLPWSEVPALIDWLQSLVGEREPKAVWASATADAHGRLTAVESQEKPWPVWFVWKGEVLRLSRAMHVEDSLVFYAPNSRCAREFAQHGEDYVGFAVRWRKRGEVVE